MDESGQRDVRYVVTTQAPKPLSGDFTMQELLESTQRGAEGK